MLILFGMSVGKGYFFTTSDMFMLEWFIIGIPSFFLALEINNQMIKGKFIFNILKNAFAGAIVAVVGIIVLYSFMEFKLFAINWDAFITMSIITIVGTGLMVLYRLIKPINVYRGLLFVIMLIFIVFYIAFVNTLPTEPISNIVSISMENILVLIIVLLLTYPLIGFMNDMLAKIRLDVRQKASK